MKVCYIGDNRNRANFGCRATSMALRDIIVQYHEVSSTIYGDITERYTPWLYKGNSHVNKLTSYFRRVRNIFCPVKDDADFITSDVKNTIAAFQKIHIKYSPLKELNDKICNCEALMLNGEGSFMFRKEPKHEFWFYLFTLAYAQSLGKKTYVLNAMFTDGTASEQNVAALQQAKEVFLKCTLVTARDELSYKYYIENIGENVVYVPDALFSWTKYSSYNKLSQSFPLAGVIFPDDKWQWQEFDFAKPYVAVSAASREFDNGDDEYIDQYVKMINSIRQKHNVIIVQTCGGEEFLKKVSYITGVKIIDNRTNILYGMSVLANAQCYVSGRWHPSILASLGGTPCVMLSSNSHKSAAIYRELKYNEADSHVYPNPPSDEDIRLIVEKVDYSIKNISRDKIREVALQNSALLHQYEQLLK